MSFPIHFTAVPILPDTRCALSLVRLSLVRLRLLMLTLALMSLTAVQAQELTATVDRDKVEIADAFRVSVNVIAADGVAVEFPEALTELGPFMVISTADQFDVPGDSGRSWTRTFQLEAYESGSLEVPAIAVKVGQQTLQTEPLAIDVQSTLDAQADPLQFREFKDLEDIPAQPSTGTWILTGLATVLACLAGWYWMRSRSSSLAPDAWVYSKLSELEAMPEFREGDRTALIPMLADITREYIQRRFHVRATRQTTAEFLAIARSDRRLDEARRAELDGLLKEADQIKFANLVPDSSQLHETLERIRSFVRETAKVADEPSDTQAAGPTQQNDESGETKVETAGQGGTA